MMLTQLTIRNFGLIDNLTIEFGKGLNILTGETGAGKSIVIDALRYALGERFSATHVRDREKPCTVEAVFDVTGCPVCEHELVQDVFSGEEPEMIVHRTYTPDGKNRVRVNGLALTVGQLKELGDHLIDFHGPNDHQMLLAETSHLAILDRLTDFKGADERYREAFNAYRDIRRQLDELGREVQDRERELDILVHQIRELEQVPLNIVRYDEYVTEQTRINNTESLFAASESLRVSFEDEESGINRTLRDAYSHLRTLNRIDGSTDELTGSLDAAQEQVDAFLIRLQSYIDSLSFDPERAAEVNAVCDLYTTLKRKYGPSMEDVLAFYDRAKKRYDLLLDFEHSDAELRKSLAVAEQEALSLASRVTECRAATAATLKVTIEKELGELGFKRVKFEVRMEPASLGPTGADTVVFHISPNPGEDLKPLAEIVSSGEAARVMLALKKALVDVDPIPVLIFDEVDAQIGGRLGDITGKKLKELAAVRQVLLITHLPQIAGFADHHYKVDKKVSGKRTVTTVFELAEQSQRVEEIAHMLGGEGTTEIALRHAHDMLARSNKS
jgi:DNA repair protein RecN (Recombination protein N)